jgi:thioesterase domain-containing protein
MRTAPEWIMPLRTSASGATPLFLIHPVGGSAMAYLWLADALDDRSCLGVEARALHQDDRDRTIAEAADVYTSAIRQLWTHGPYALGGWSMGATVAFEVARRLQAAGERIGVLALLDPEPGWTVPPPSDDRAVVAAFVRDMLRQSRAPEEVDALTADVVAGADGPDVAGSAVERLRRAGLIPPGSEEIVARRIDVFRGLGSAHAAYRPTPADLAVTVFSGRDGAERQRAAWQQFARAGFRQHLLDADHYSLIGPAHADRIAGTIVETITGAEDGAR